MQWSIVSNAAEMSNNFRTETLTLSEATRRSLSTVRRAVSVMRPGRYADWKAYARLFLFRYSVTWERTAFFKYFFFTTASREKAGSRQDDSFWVDWDQGFVSWAKASREKSWFQKGRYQTKDLWIKYGKEWRSESMYSSNNEVGTGSSSHDSGLHVFRILRTVSSDTRLQCKGLHLVCDWVACYQACFEWV